eukprot:389454-Amphidinium_carterae.1
MIEVDVDAEVDAAVADLLGNVLDDVNDGTAELELVDVKVIVDVDVLEVRVEEALVDVGVVELLWVAIFPGCRIQPLQRKLVKRRME